MGALIPRRLELRGLRQLTTLTPETLNPQLQAPTPKHDRDPNGFVARKRALQHLAAVRFVEALCGPDVREATVGH